MLVVAPIRPTTLRGSFIRQIASNAPSTPAAPHISNFMSSIDCAGLIEIPPLSKHSPLPTSVTGFAPDRKSTRLNSSHLVISYAVFCLKKKKTQLEERESRGAHQRVGKKTC